jgi:hypothetical protein
MGKSVRFDGVEGEDALICNSRKAMQLFGYPRVSTGQMVTWIADWAVRGGESLAKPTHFENRAGDF